MPTNTAKQFIDKLKTHRSPEEAEKLKRYFKNTDGDQFIGIRMGQVFALAKEFIEMTPAEIEKVLESKIHEVRAGGCSIMDKQARRKKTTDERRKELYDLYLRRHDRINNWDLVDVCAIHVIGGYLADRPRTMLYKLARSKNMWERRTAIVSTAYFIRKNDLDDTFKIAEMLLKDNEDLVHKATGWMLRFSGDKDLARLLSFLDKYAATMPRTALRYSIEKLDKKTARTLFKFEESKGAMMQRITPFLWFENNNAEEAMNFYVSIFPNSKVVRVTHYPEGGPAPVGTVMTVEAELDGEEFVGLNGGPQDKFNWAVSFVVNCETQEEVDYYWEKLSEGGGEKSRCGWVKDKFGLWWQVTPTVLTEFIGTKDPEKAKRVMAAMMQMDKIEIEPIKRAYSGD